MARFSGDFPKNYDVFQASGGYQQEPEIQAWRAFPWVSLRKVHKNMVASISLGTFAIKLCTFRLPAGHRRSFIHSLASAKRSASPGGHQRDGADGRTSPRPAGRAGRELHSFTGSAAIRGSASRVRVHVFAASLTPPRQAFRRAFFLKSDLSIRIDKSSVFYGQNR